MRATKTSGVLAAGAVALAAGGLAPLAHADLDFSISLNFSWCEPEIIAHDVCDDFYVAPVVTSWRYSRDCEDYGHYRRWYSSAWSYGTHCGPIYGRRVYAYTDDCGVIAWRPVYTPVYRSVWADDAWCAPRSGVSVWYSSGNFSIGFGSRHAWGRRWRDCDDWGWGGWRSRDVCRPVVFAPVIYQPVIVANPVIVRPVVVQPVVVQPVVYQPPVIAQPAPVLVPTSPVVVQQPVAQPGAFVPDPALTSVGQMGPVAVDGADNQGRAKPRRFAQAGDGSNLPTPALPSGVREIKPDALADAKPGKPVALPSAKPLSPEAKPVARTDKPSIGPARGQAREFGTVRKPGDTRVITTKPVETTIDELKRPATAPSNPAAKPARTFGRERAPVAPAAPAVKQPGVQPEAKPIIVPSNSPARTDKPARRVESRPFGGGATAPAPRKPSVAPASPAPQPAGPVFAPSAPASKPSVGPSTGPSKSPSTSNGGGFAPAKPARTFGRERTVAPAAPAPAIGPVAPAPSGDKKK